LGITGDIVWENAMTFDLLSGNQVCRGDAIFPRLDIDKELEALTELRKKQMEEAGQEIPLENVPLELKPAVEFDDFTKLDLRVGEIIEAEKHPKADKLLVFQVRMGTETRQIISGVAKDYKPEEMIGKKMVVVANLKPRKLRGLESHGMFLFAEDGDRTRPVETTAPAGSVVD
jgi:methionyl-tRNA synthetase